MAIATITASEQGNLSNLTQLFDGVSRTPYKWLLLQSNLLDGSFHPIDHTLQQQIGWQGSSLSDASGLLSSEPTLNITLASVAYITGIRIIGDYILNEYPIDFTVKVYNASLELVYTQHITGNTELSRLVEFSNTYQASLIKITVTKVNKPSTTVKLLEVSYTTNINELMDAPVRRIHGKVEITYMDPFMDATVVANADSEQEFAKAINVTHGNIQPAFKGFSLHDNILDGTYFPLSIEPEYEVGWWSNELSDGTGSFTDSPYAGLYGIGAYGISEYTGLAGIPNAVTIELIMSVRPFFELVVLGDALLNSFPVDFDIELFDANGTLLYTENVVGNTECDWHKTIDTVANVCIFKLTVYRINKPYEVLKIVNLYSTITKVYDMDSVVSIGLLEELAYTDNTLPIGAVSSNEIDIVLDNTDRDFSRDNPNSKIATMLKKNRVVKAWLGIEVSQNNIDWYEMGTFYTINWKAPISSTEATLTARDRLELLRSTEFKATQIYADSTLYELFELVLLDAGIPYNEFIIDPGLQNIRLPYAWFSKGTHREALTTLASCGLISVFCDRRNRIVVDLLTNQISAPVCTMDNDTNVYDKDYPMALSDVINSVEVYTYKILLHTELASIYEYSKGISIPANTTSTLSIVFKREACFNITVPIVTAAEGVSIDSYTAYTWGMDITVTNTNNFSASIADINIYGNYVEAVKALSVVAENAESVLHDGRISSEPLDHKFIQDYNYAQTLAQQALDMYLDTGDYVQLDCRGSIALNINDAIEVRNAYDNSTRLHRVSRQDITWDGALRALIEGR
jgi:hypothetical protein